MASLASVSRHALPVLAALVLGAHALGCTTHVASGAGEPGTGGKHDPGGIGGAGGAEGTGGTGGAACTSYAGDGCKPGDTQLCPFTGGTTSSGPVTATAYCSLVPGEPCATQWNWGNCNTPIVLSFDGAPVEYLADSVHAFDVNGSKSLVTDWPTAHTPWLAVDRDGDGRIGDGAELFGSMTVLSSGRRAQNGFAALRELDADGDGRITPKDPGFASLLVWSDRDGDRRSSPEELSSASKWELLSIDLDYTVEPRCDARGNCEVERASFRYRDAGGVERTGAVVDVHLAAQRW